jgi:hypothetical protein
VRGKAGGRRCHQLASQDFAPVAPVEPVGPVGPALAFAHAGGTREIAQFGLIPHASSVFATTS